MAFEYNDDDLGLDNENEELPENEQSAENDDSWLDIMNDAKNIFTDDEDESNFDDTNNIKEDLENSNFNETPDTENISGRFGDSVADTSSNVSQLSSSATNNLAGSSTISQATTATTSSASIGATAGASTGVAGAGAAAGTAGAGAAAGAGGAAAGAGAGAGGILAAAWPALLIILLVIVIIVISAAIAMAFDDEYRDGLASFNNITNEHFYGMRLIYEDADILTNSLQLSYKQYIVDILSLADDETGVSLNISLPENFDNSSNIDENIINMSIGIGNIVANNDDSYEDIEFASLYQDIQYFGLTSSQAESVHEFIINYLQANNILTITSSASVADIINNVATKSELQYIYNICEKIIIEDVLATSDGLPNFDKHKYIACIYMPNTEVTAEGMAYRVNVENEDIVEFKLIYNSNGTENILLEDSADKSWNDTVEYAEVDENVEVYLEQFNQIDSSNLNLYSNGISLFDAVKLSNNHFNKNSQDIYVWLPNSENLLYLTFNSTNIFAFNEFNIEVY